MNAFSLFLPAVFPLYVCVIISPSPKDTSHTVLGPTLTSLSLHYLSKGPISYVNYISINLEENKGPVSKYSHTLGTEL